MSRQRTARDGSPQVTGDDAHRRLLAGVPVTERRLVLAGVSTLVLEGGDGLPLVPADGARWASITAYPLDRSRTPSVQQANRRLLHELGLPQIPPEDLARIGVPTTFIWGRHDRVKPLRTAPQASAPYGWPLQVIENAGHVVVADRPDAFLEALRAALGNR